MNAQIKAGIKAGVVPAFSPNTHYMIMNRENPRNEFVANVSSIQNGTSIGAFAQIGLEKSFFLRAEALYNQYETNYEMRYTWGERFRSSNETQYVEKTKRLDIPVSLGANLGNFEVITGLVARFILDNQNEMRGIAGYSESMSPIQFGLQSGIGLNILNLNIGLTYQMDFQNYGEHIYINGRNMDLQNRPTRLIASIAYTF
jgi:hypothetical protein